MTATQGVTRYLGGEAGHRSFFGGTHSKSRIAFVSIFMTAGLILTPIFGWPAIVLAVSGSGLAFALTARTHRGSILERRTKRSRWRARQRVGSTQFVPYEVGEWDQLQTAQAHGTKKERLQAAASIAAMRSNPDGADGMGWLQYGRNLPGIAWHHPRGEQPYLSAAFSVSGQLRGVETEGVLGRAAVEWGKFLAARAVPSSLVGSVQTLTRVLPPDTARQQHWVSMSLDPGATREQQESYKEVILRTGADAMVQRHYVIVCWPLSAQFVAAALKYGAGRDGWRALMAAEIDATVRGLQEAQMGKVGSTTARQLSALILHQQNPSLPIDAVRTADPLNFGVKSHDEFSAHIVSGVEVAGGKPVDWWHRTAAIRGEAMTVAPRTQLWTLDLLIGRELTFIRSVSFHMQLVPAAEAKAAARRDLIRDMAEDISDKQHGRLTDDDTSVAMTAASRRRADLAAGSHHHGVEWIGYVTISANTRDELALASRQLAEACATGLGVEQLDWMDSYQSAASGTTWPIGRGLKRSHISFASRVYQGLAGRSEKEAIS